MKIIGALETGHDDCEQELRVVPDGNAYTPAEAAPSFVLGPIGAHRGHALHLAAAFFALVPILGHGEPVRAVATPQLRVGLATDDAFVVGRAGAVGALANSRWGAASGRESDHEKAGSESATQHVPRVAARSSSGDWRLT